jgi:hypothetical protein
MYLPRFLPLASLIAFLGCSGLAMAHGPDRHQVNYIDHRQQLTDLEWQARLRALPAWKQFRAAHPGWAVEFDDALHKPHRAYGPAVEVPGADALDRAWHFLANELSGFGVPMDELVHLATVPTGKFHYVHFGQVHAGLPVLNARAMVKLDHQGRVLSFGLGVHDAITVGTMPVLPAAAAHAVATAGLGDVTGVEELGLHILPVPRGRAMDYRLVHVLRVHTAPVEGIPGRYRCYVDADHGALLYRWNEVLNHSNCPGRDGDRDASAGAQVNATLHPLSALYPAEVKGLPELRVSITGQTLHTDALGWVDTGLDGPQQATIQLRGRWSHVTTNNITPTTVVSLQEGMNTVSVDGFTTIQQRDAYYHVNQIHAHMKAVLPDFNGLDISLPTKVDVTGGTCNAYYDGQSINFFAQGGGCRSLATLGDVVYHEYGHGINDLYYQSLGANWQNGAMHEGYADVWALTLTDHPVLAEGWQLSSTASYIRRYDQAPKVYPSDLTGEVHADGEIIAGAWWDTYQLIGDRDVLLGLWAEAFAGMQATAPNGTEGVAFREVLLDVLQADDDDGDITNGTPNGAAIVEGFARHGITLLSNLTIVHEALEAGAAEVGIPLEAEVDIPFPTSLYMAGVRAFYRLNNEPEWHSLLMTNAGGDLYVGELPAQPAGTIVHYYLATEDIFGAFSAVNPVGANKADPNLPHNILVGYALMASQDIDFNNDLGDWEHDLPTDNATAGQWEVTEPIPSFSGTNGAGIMVQPGHQHTPGGNFCWVTQNAASPYLSMGTADVDNGTTTILSTIIDLSGYSDPAFSYWRWYINDPPNGANPASDWWQVFVSDNGGATWVPVEETRTSDPSWRRMAFRVKDFVQVTPQFRMKFHASDSIRPEQSQNGGSLVEAALDDVQLWEAQLSTDVMHRNATTVVHYPDPASEVVNVLLALGGRSVRAIEVRDMTGRVVARPAVGGPRLELLQFGVDQLAPGHYVMRIRLDEGAMERRFSVAR